MSAPICHRTIGPRVFLERDGALAGMDDPQEEECIGSRCSLWVPRVAPRDAPLGTQLEPAPEGVLLEEETYQNQGQCADNLRRSPWRDPAAT